jgi:hypothetical protein
MKTFTWSASEIYMWFFLFSILLTLYFWVRFSHLEAVKNTYNTSIGRYSFEIEQYTQRNDLFSYMLETDLFLSWIIQNQYGQDSEYQHLSTRIYREADRINWTVEYSIKNTLGFLAKKSQDFIFTSRGELLKSIQ